MKHNIEYIIEVQEGNVSNYIDALMQMFGGTINGNHYEYRKGNNHISYTNFGIIDGFELSLAKLHLDKSLTMKSAPDNRPDLFHLTFITRGKTIRMFDDQMHYAEAGSALGIFLYNGLFEMDSHFLNQMNIQLIIYKFSRSVIEKIIPESKMLLDKLFPHDEPRWYHSHFSPQLKKMIDDLYYYQSANFGSKALVIGRGLELFTLLMHTLNNQLDKEALNGLHVEDYHRMLEIKKFLLDNLSTKVALDDISQQFGISRSKLKRDFKTLFDTSVQQFQTLAKMDEACRRLQSGNFSVTEVGFDMGYQNPAKFSTMFKKIKGITPKDVIPA